MLGYFIYLQRVSPLPRASLDDISGHKLVLCVEGNPSSGVAWITTQWTENKVFLTVQYNKNIVRWLKLPWI